MLGVACDNLILQEIDEDTFREIEYKNSLAGEFIWRHNYFKMMKLNFIELRKALVSFEKENNSIVIEDKYMPYITNANRLFINLLGSFYIYVDHYDQYFKTLSDDGDPIAKLTSKYYDAYFLYRFFYKLRNFVVHAGIPITKIKMCPNNNFFIMRDYLLNRSDCWGENVRIELKKEKDSFYVVELVEDFFKMMNKFHIEMVDSQTNEMISLVHFFNSYRKQIGNNYYYPQIYDKEKIKDGLITYYSNIVEPAIELEKALREECIDIDTGKRIET